MSQFADTFAEVGRPALMEQLGRSLTFVDPIVGSVSLTALVTEVDTEEDDDLDGRTQVYRARVIIGRDTSSPDGGVADPKKGSTVTLDSQSWTVEEIESQTESLTRLRIARPVKVEVSRGRFRGERR